MTFTDLIKNVQPFATKNSPSILAGVAVLGTITTTVLAVRATPTAVKIIERNNEVRQAPLTKVEVVKATWKLYVPATLTGVTTIACIVGANTISLKRNAVLAGAYTLSEAAAREYKAKVLETIGEKKEGEVRKKIAEDRVAEDRDQQGRNSVVVMGGSEQLCYDMQSDRYFKSDIESLRALQNELNKRLLMHDEITLNELYSELGLGHIGMGDDMGWVSDNLIEFVYSTIIAPDGRPALVLSYRLDPNLDIVRRGF